MSMLQRYHIIDLDDLRRAGRKASDYRGPKEVVAPLTRDSGQFRYSRRPRGAVVELLVR
jgi:hypothetical protein